MKRAVLFAIPLFSMMGCYVQGPPPNNSAYNGTDPNANTGGVVVNNGAGTTTTPTTATTPTTTTPITTTPVATPTTGTSTTTTTTTGANGTVTHSTTVTTFDPNGAADPTKTNAFQEVAVVTDAPAEVKILSADGRPKEFHAGSADAFYLWQDARGTRWHVRATTTGQWHRFHGYIVADGPLSGVRTTRTDWSDRVRVNDKRASFDVFTKGQSEGIDFSVAGDKCVHFYLMMDGKAQADKIKIGADSTLPPKAYFKLCH